MHIINQDCFVMQQWLIYGFSSGRILSEGHGVNVHWMFLQMYKVIAALLHSTTLITSNR